MAIDATRPVRPVPMALQLVPSHRATPRALTPPAVRKSPPTKSAGRPGPAPSSSKTVSTRAEVGKENEVPARPDPKGSQADPPHRAMWFTGTPPAVTKKPPMYSAGPFPSSYTAHALTVGENKPSPARGG